MVEEIWRDVPGYEGLYQISNIGRVKNSREYSPSTDSKKTKFGKIKTQAKNNFGYMRVTFYKNGQSKMFFVHRLVAEVFLEKDPGKDVVNHIDGDKTNNHFFNLEWVTSSENMKHAYKNGLVDLNTPGRKRALSERHNARKRSVAIFNNNGIELGRFESLSEASEFFGYSKKYFSNVAINGNKKYKVVFLEDNK